VTRFQLEFFEERKAVADCIKGFPGARKIGETLLNQCQYFFKPSYVLATNELLTGEGVVRRECKNGLKMSYRVQAQIIFLCLALWPFLYRFIGLQVVPDMFAFIVGHPPPGVIGLLIAERRGGG